MTSNNFDTFKQELLSSKFYRRILKQDPYQNDIIAVILSGSRMSGLIDFISDYDFLILTKQYNNDLPLLEMTYKGKRVHFHFRQYIRFLHWSGPLAEQHLEGAIWLFNYSEDCLFYINEKYRPAWDFIFKNKEKLIKISTSLLWLSVEQQVNTILSTKEFCSGQMNKYLHGALIGYLYLTNQLPQDIEPLMCLKRERYKAMSYQYADVLLSWIEKYKRWIEEQENIGYDAEEELYLFRKEQKKLINDIR